MGLRVVVVEDDTFTRMLLCSHLRELGHEVVGEAGTCADGIASARVTQPDVVLVDLDLGPGPNGVDLAYAVRKSLPLAGIVLLTSYVDIRLIGDFRPLPAGTIFLVKRSLSEVNSLESALVISRDPDASREAERLCSTGALRRLRDGQIEIMRLVATGCTNAEIARQRHLEEPSVAKAISRLVTQLDLKVTSAHNPRVLITQAYFALIAR